MKKVLLMAAVAVLGCSALNAQDSQESNSSSSTTKGTWFFGAETSLSFVSNKTTPEFDGEEFDNEIKNSTFSFTPSANYFVADNLAIGLDLLFQTSKDEFEDFGENFEVKTNTLALIPNATYFFGEGNFRPYLGVGAGYLSTGGEDDFSKFSGLVIRGQGGIAYFINTSVALNFSVEYLNANLSNKEESDFKNKSNTLGLGLGFSFFLK